MSTHLDGYRIIDLSNVLSGPFCAYQFAQVGAEVIKVEIPERGDLARQLGASKVLNKKKMGASFLAQNSGKHSITINLKNEYGRNIFKRLVATADVVIENFRPGVMERLGLGYEILKKIKPDLIYCAISGYGATGPLKDNPAYDQIIQGLSGIMSITGDKSSAPLRVGYPIADTLGGLTAAFAISTALLRKEKAGTGDYIDVSMLESVLASMGWIISNLLIANIPPKPLGNENMTAAPSGAFTTQKGLLNIAANKQEHFETLCKVINRVDLITNPLYAERENRKINRQTLKTEIEQALYQDTAKNWETLFNQNNIPAGRVLSVQEILQHQQVSERNFIINFDEKYNTIQNLTVNRAGFRFASGDPKPEFPPKTLGYDTQRILESLGYQKDEIDDFKNKGAI